MIRYRYPDTGSVLLYITYIIISIIELFLGLRIILKLFGAHTSAPFVAWVYATTAPLLQPFIGIFPSPMIDGVFTIDIAALIAILVYGFIAYLIEAAVSSISRGVTVIE